MTIVERTTVAIVGAGPVGMVLAAELGARGVPCVLIEERATLLRQPRANTHSARAMEIYRRHGVSQALRTTGLPRDYPTDASFFTRFVSHELARVQLPPNQEWIARARAGDLGWPTPEPHVRCSQLYLEPLLEARVCALPSVAYRRGWRMTQLRAEADRVVIELESVAGLGSRTLIADYVAGCDGSRSSIRTAAGIRFAGEGGANLAFMGGAMIATHLRSPSLYARLGHARQSWQYFSITPQQRSILVALNGADEFLFHVQLADHERVEATDVGAKLIHAIGTETPFQVISAAPWRAGRALVAERFVSGRIALVGDAAHLFTPTGGFGLNTGIEDAANLGWKLAAIVQGWGSAALLASYDDERRPIALRNTAFALELAGTHHRLPMSPQLEAATVEGDAARESVREYLRHRAAAEYVTPGIQLGARYDDSPIVWQDGTVPPPDAPTRYVPSAVPGGRLPHLWQHDGGSLFDALDWGFTLIELDSDAPTTEAAAVQIAAARHGVPLRVVPIRHPEARALYERKWVLVRPDQHVAWRGDRLDNFHAVLSHVTGFGQASMARSHSRSSRMHVNTARG